MGSIDARHDHHAMGGSMAMVQGVPSLSYMQQIFWAFVGTAIAVATMSNLINKFLYYQRISVSVKEKHAAKPKSYLFQVHATMSAVIREYSYYSLPLSVWKKSFYLPTVGPLTMLVGYVVLIVVCCLYRLDPDDLLQWEDIGYRAGYIAICQLPLIVLLAGKRNIIGLFVGTGYEHLNWFHRWTARSLLLTVLIHGGFWISEWAKFGYVMTKIKQDTLTQRGIAAGSILLWLVVSSVAPIRGLSYEIFVVQHIISWLGFLAAVYLHVPDQNRIWVWLPLAFWAFDRFLRAALMIWTNLGVLQQSSNGLFACKATFELLDQYHTRIIINYPPITWHAGQHIFLTCHPLAPLTSHPFTIASIPSDGRIELIVRAKKGATRKFFQYASRVQSSLPITTAAASRSVLIEGPYSRIRPLRQFDSLILLAGSTGATFTVPLLRDVVSHWTGNSPLPSMIEPASGAVTRYIRFVWVMKQRCSITWFASKLETMVETVESLRNEGLDVAVDISLYVTCDDGLTNEKSSQGNVSIVESTQQANVRSDGKTPPRKYLEASSRSPSPDGECCCTNIVEENDITPPCNCETNSSRPNSSSSTGSGKVLDPRIRLISGRPHIESIIRKTVEMAHGETAVVVCGPPGLVQSTRNTVTSVSDDRAVHKGTGAQGIWCHAEVFGYA